MELSIFPFELQEHFIVINIAYSFQTIAIFVIVKIELDSKSFFYSI